MINHVFISGKTKRRDSKKKSESGDGLHREQNLLSGGRMLDNQAKWRKLGYKGDASQPIRKTDTLLTGGEFGTVKKVGEIRRTSDSDINKSAIEKSNSLSNAAPRLTELNGVKKDLINQEKRRRLSLMDEKDLHLGGKHIYINSILHLYIIVHVKIYSLKILIMQYFTLIFQHNSHAYAYT